MQHKSEQRLFSLAPNPQQILAQELMTQQQAPKWLPKGLGSYNLGCNTLEEHKARDRGILTHVTHVTHVTPVPEISCCEV